MDQIDNAEIVAEYLRALLAGNRKVAGRICEGFLEDGASVKELYESIIKQALYEVGSLWELNQITVADEHMATAISEGILNSFYSRIIPVRSNGKKVALSCVEGETHQVGLKMVADIFEMHGWEPFLIGGGIPLKELMSYLDKLQPQLLAVSLSVYFNYKKFQSMTEAVREHFPGLTVLAGGQGFRHVEPDKLPKSNITYYLQDLNALDNYLTNIK